MMTKSFIIVHATIITIITITIITITITINLTILVMQEVCPSFCHRASTVFPSSWVFS